MEKIELWIQKKEDIVLLIQGLNWIRQHNIANVKMYTETMQKVPEELRPKFDTLVEQADTHDRLMTLIVQLDKILETGKNGRTA